jgi:hypothetical protein
MDDSLYFRDRAKQAIRLARDSTDAELQKSLTDLALDYFSKAVEIEARALGKYPHPDRQ